MSNMTHTSCPHIVESIVKQIEQLMCFKQKNITLTLNAEWRVYCIWDIRVCTYSYDVEQIGGHVCLRGGNKPLPFT